MNSITGNILINFDKMPGSQEEKEYQKEVYSAIKLQLSEMEKYEQTTHFNHCHKCNMVLTIQVLPTSDRNRTQKEVNHLST